MLDQIRAMERAGRWAELRQAVPDLLADACGDEKARLCLSLATAYYYTSANAGDWRQALTHAHDAWVSATPGGFLYVWALQKLSSLSVDMGRPRESQYYARAYLKLAPQYPELRCITPYVVRDLSHAAYQQRRWAEAVRLRMQALALFEALGDSVQVIRTQLNLVWAYARAGKPHLARRYMPVEVPADMQSLQAGAWTVIYATERNWPAAIVSARQALNGNRQSCDCADAAEICLILAQSLKALDASADSSELVRESVSLAARQDRSAYTLLVLSQRQRGGDTPDQAASRGSGGWHPDARYTTGVA